LFFRLESEIFARWLQRPLLQRRTGAHARPCVEGSAGAWMSAGYNAKVENTFIQDRQRDVRVFHFITLRKRTDCAGTFQTRRDGGLFR
jgi:hypothetical protein